MKPSPSRILLLAFLSMILACMGELPPPPVLQVTSPERGLIQSEAGQVLVEGRTASSSSGSPVVKVLVNNVPAKVTGDGTFSAVVEVPAGAMLLETVAFSEEGGKAIDARAIHVGELRPVGARIDRAVYATLSADAFAKISETANQILNSTDLSTLLAPVSLGGGTANAKVTVTKLVIGNANIALTPVDGGLMLSVQLEGLDVGANVAYAGSLVPDGSTNVTVTADAIAIGGTLVVTPNGTSFKTTVGSPNVTTTALRLNASGLIGTILDLLNNNLASTFNGLITRAAEGALEPLINTALGALKGPKRLDVMGKVVELEGSFSEVEFTTEGAMASLNLAAKIDGSESSPGFIYTANGTPKLEMGYGLQVGLSDDLLNNVLAQVHALGLLDLHLAKDFGLFDTADIQLTMPPMISANTGDGSVRLVLGDMIATVTNDGSTLVRAAINASVDVEIKRGAEAADVAIAFGKVHAVVNLLDNTSADTEVTPGDLSGASNAGIGLQLDSLSDVLVTVPVPTIQGVTFDNLSLRGDSGYMVASAQIH